MPPPTDADIVILAGDIDVGVGGVRWAKCVFDKPTLYVAGNHEFYRGDIAYDVQHMRNLAEGSLVQLLDCNVIELRGVRFIGATLWTDFRLMSADEADVARAMDVAERCMSDFNVIRLAAKR